MDCDINLHGGWERYNLIERNQVFIPRGFTNSGSHYPISWAGGKQATWAGSSGARNVLFNNRLWKQEDGSMAFEQYTPYGDDSNRVFQFGWDRASPEGIAWEPLAINGVGIETWRHNEATPFYSYPNTGVNANCLYMGTSLVGVNFTENCTSAYPSTCDLDDFDDECTTASECEILYPGSAADCSSRDTSGHICVCGHDVCGCSRNKDAEFFVAPIFTQDPPAQEPATSPPTPQSASTSFSPITSQCGILDHQAECSTTKQCRQMYEDATDCWNGGGGVCLCGSSGRVCGCSV